MNLQQVELKSTGKFSSFFLDYLSNKDQLLPFFSASPSSDNFKAQIKSQSFASEKRKILVDTLQSQYQGYDIDGKVSNNILSLEDETTFTVTTGHQLNLFTGPLYVIYKLITTIRTCDMLKEKFPEYNFVPVYWMASEDHDFDEIDHFHFNGETFRWETNQSGAVGRFKVADMQSLLKELAAFPPLFLDAYSGKKKTLSESVRQYLHDLFGKYGLVILDADNRAQKSLFKEVMHKDIVERKIAPVVQKTTEKLQDLGYSTQVNPREINFFYLTEDGRYRISFEDELYKLVDSDKTFTEAEITAEIESAPEKFSPNVILRPLYEEQILPNLGYVGGPSELIYWLQLKDLFSVFNTPFPLLLPRNFALIVPANVERKRKKTGIPITGFFEDENSIMEAIIDERSEKDLDISEQKDSAVNIFNAILQQAEKVDPSLLAHIEAMQKSTLKKLDGIETKIRRAEKKNHTTLLRQIEDIRNHLFPNGSLQERHDNFLNFYQTDKQFIENLMEKFDPFDFKFNILTYGE